MAKRIAPNKQAIDYEPVEGTPYVDRLIIEPDEDRYYAEIPSLPGCYSWGHTYEEALRNIKEAAELWLEVKKEAGEPIPIEDPLIIKKAALTIGVLA